MGLVNDLVIRAQLQFLKEMIQMNDKETVEQEIQRKGLTAPRVTPADIEANIASEHYFTAAEGVYGAAETADAAERMSATMPGPLQLLTFCVLLLRNGFTVVGTSACASPENFNEELGKRIARENAVHEMWPLMGYALREKLAERGPALDEAGLVTDPLSI